MHAGVVSTDTFFKLKHCASDAFLLGGNTRKQLSCLEVPALCRHGARPFGQRPYSGDINGSPPILLWCASDFKWKRLLRFPIVIGTIISLGIAVPWYVWAEMRSPGFIDYFITGEHFKHYLDSSWSGDKYGFPKQQPLGVVWLFLSGRFCLG